MNKAYSVITDRILEALKQGVVPWHKPWKTSGHDAPKNLKSKHPYRGINVMLLGLAGYGSPWWVSFKQAQAMGGCVRKGERGTPVVFWKRIKKIDEDPETGEQVEKVIPLLRYYTVFNVEQCDGLTGKVPAPPEAEEVKPVAPIAACEAVVKAMPKRPKIGHGGGRACYSPMGDKVQMPKRDAFDGSEEYYSTLFHELAHATGHDSRLGRSGITNATFFGTTNYSREELVAEIGAAYLCGAVEIGVHTLENSAAYVANWLRKLKDDPKMVVIAAAQAAKAADFVLGRERKVSEEAAAA